MLASCSKDASALIWDTEVNAFGYLHTYGWLSQTFEVRTHLRGHEDPVPYLAWSPDDTRILTCSNDRTVRLWNVEVLSDKSSNNPSLIHSSRLEHACIYSDITVIQWPHALGCRTERISFLVVWIRISSYRYYQLFVNNRCMLWSCLVCGRASNT